jgi:hypothetical protein
LHDSEERQTALAAARNVRPVAVAIETEGNDLEPDTRALLDSLRPDVVIAIVDATRPVAESARRLRSLGRVDAIAVDGALDVDDPAAALVLDVPVIRLDGVPVDRFGWAALLCAHLVARDGR